MKSDWKDWKGKNSNHDFFFTARFLEAHAQIVKDLRSLSLSIIPLAGCSLSSIYTKVTSYVPRTPINSDRVLTTYTIAAERAWSEGLEGIFNCQLYDKELLKPYIDHAHNKKPKGMHRIRDRLPCHFSNSSCTSLHGANAYGGKLH